ncbi:MAG: glutamine synthetase family protein [Pseudomonadota bacterium]|nr:glutamine synthetase family protein [Pseudomonadota bacterium]
MNGRTDDVIVHPMRCAELLQRIREQGTRQVRIAWADLHGAFRSKTLICGNGNHHGGSEDYRSGDHGSDSSALADALQHGVGMVSTLLLKDASDRTALPVFEPGSLAALPGFGAANNMVLMPDPESYLTLPWAPGTGWLRASPVWADGTPVEADPRRVLQRAVAALNDAGYGLQVGLEVEFHVYRITDARMATAASAWPAEPPAVELVHPGYQLLSESHADAADAVLQIVRDTALGLGLPLGSLEIEFGPSQFEAVFAPTDALRAADRMLLFRNGVRQALRRAGYHASFVCRPPFPNAVASGWHLHQSLVDAEGANALCGTHAEGDAMDARRMLSDVGRHWLAGLLAHAAGMAALCVPSAAGYSRFQGSVMAPCAPVWGFDNRGAMLRVVGAPGSSATRIENRLPEPLANPYLALAAQIAAGLDGLQHGLDPGPATTAPYAANAAAESGRAKLPASLPEALAALAADAVMQKMLGPSMAVVHAAVRRQELARQAAADDPEAWEAAERFGRF